MGNAWTNKLEHELAGLNLAIFYKLGINHGRDLAADQAGD